MTDMPEPGMDRIRLSFDSDGRIVEATWKNGGTKFLRSTPVREHAEGMRDAICRLTSIILLTTEPPRGVQAEIDNCDRLLATIEAEEEWHR